MTPEIPTKRKRGGQPGNKNARSNRGNPQPRPNYRNRGGGAPLGNQNARKRPNTPHIILLQDYKEIAEAVAWIEAHKDKLNDASFTADDQRDRALFASYVGLTPEALAEQGLEYRLGLYSVLQASACEDEGIAA